MKKFVTVTVVAALTALAMNVAAAPRLRPLGVEQMARYGATHELTVTAADLTESTDNVAQTNTVALAGPCAYEYVGFQLERAFDSVANTNLGSIAFTATMGTVLLVTNVQVAADTRHQFSFVRPNDMTMTGQDATNTIAATWGYSGVLTNGQSTTFTTIMGAPGAPMNLDEFDTGQLRLFLRILR